MGLLDGLIYPPAGFHFSVVIEMFPQTPQDFRFQSVTGLSVDMPTETVAEGGELRFKHQLPGVPQYGKLQLKRGLFQGSFIVNWCKNAIEKFEIEPHNVLVTLLNNLHLPVAVWHVSEKVTAPIATEGLETDDHPESTISTANVPEFIV